MMVFGEPCDLLDGNAGGRALNFVLEITLLSEGFGESCTLQKW